MAKWGTVWIGLLLMMGGAHLAHGQQKTAGDWAWKPLLQHEGVAFTYIFYSEANNHDNGVVLKIANTNDYPIAYRFTIIFRAGDGSVHEEYVEGTLRAHETQTGDSAGLFWVPFTDGRSIGELGLRGFKIEKSAPGTLQL